MPDRVSVGKEQHAWRWDPAAELVEPLPDLPVFDEPLDDLRA